MMGGCIAAVVLIPLAGAVMALFVARHGGIIGMAAAVLTVLAAARVADGVRANGPSRHSIGEWRAPLGIELRADGPAALMLVVFGLIGALVMAHALVHFQPGRRRTMFVILGLFCWGALDALLLSNDVFNLYVSLELITLGSVALIALEHTPAALAAALRYLLLALLGSLGYLFGVALLYATHGALDVSILGTRALARPVALAAFAFMITGLCLKAAVFPVHAWLPPVYASASPPVSALLSGLFGKASFIVLLRIWPEALPELDPLFSQLIGVLGAIGILWGSILALVQRRLAMLLAYSSLAHVGYLLLFVPLASAAARSGVVYLAISHAAASAAMFTAAGTLARAVGSDSIEQLRGIAHRRPVVFFSIGIAGMSLMGLPPSGGFIAKWLLVRGALERGQWWWSAVVIAGGLVAAGYVFRILRGAFLRSVEDEPCRPVSPASEVVPFALALISLALGVAPSWPLGLLAGAPT